MVCRFRALGLAMALAPFLSVPQADAATQEPQRDQAQTTQPTSHRPLAANAAVKHNPALAEGAKPHAVVRHGGGPQCVPFARNASGIIVSGNAHLWWGNAAGVYARGQVPEASSVLSFRANRSMRLGHVAVVNRVIDSRQIEIDHANWAGPGGRKGLISRGVSVVDVSNNNDWTAVRVKLGRTDNYGSIYPTNGFIYERPANSGTMLAAAPAHADPDGARLSAPGPIDLYSVRTAALVSIAVAPTTFTLMPELNAAPRDLRPRDSQQSTKDNSGYASVSYVGGTYEQVAEAPVTSRRTLRRGPNRRTH